MPTQRESETAVALSDPLVGTIFDKRFRVDERLAAGGFGAIYRATHIKSGHAIALKVLHPTLASDLGVLARFRREGTTLTSLRNPHTITAYEFGQSDKTLFIVLELLHGESLYEHYSTHGPLEWKRVVHIARQVCESLEEAHAQGIVHRDLKPTNIHLESVEGDRDFVKVLDFGIAKILRGHDQDSGDITNVGQMIGTLDYMSPEQMVGGQVTGQTDIYTLGILMYEMIAGTRPFPESASAGAALAAMLKTTPEPLYLRAPVPRPLDEIVMRCLERETTRRYRSVAQLREELERLGNDGVPANTATVRLAKQDLDNSEVTAIAPPPPQHTEERTAERRIEPIEWDEDDEHAPTSTRRPDGSDDYSKTPPVRANRLLERPIDRAPERAVDRAVAKFPATPRVRPPTGPVPSDPKAIALGIAPTAITPPIVLPPSAAAPPRSVTTIGPGAPTPPAAQPPSSLMATAHGLGPHAPRPGPSTPPQMTGNRSVRAPTVPPPLGAGRSLTPMAGAPHMPPMAGAPHMPPMAGPPFHPAPGALPATPVPTYIPPTPPMSGNKRIATAAYDMGNIAARDTMIRRLVWGAVLVVAAIVGFVVASQI